MIAVILFLFIIGLIVGSFLNVVILRTISNESIVFPGSKCPKCQTPLKWYHNIPILSFIFLRGKCAFCHEKISFQYPLVELITGLVFSGLGYVYLYNIDMTKLAWFINILMYCMAITTSCLLIVISGTDFKEMKVSNSHTYSLISLGVIYSLIIGSMLFFPDIKFGGADIMKLFSPILYTLFAIIVAFILLEGLRRILNFLISTEAFGDGDSYIYAGIMGSLTALYGATDIKFIAVSILILFVLSILLSVIISFPFYIKQLVVTKNWKVLSALLLFILSAPLYFFAGYNGLLDNIVVLAVSTAVLVAIGTVLCLLIIKGIKDKTENSMQIPFGPALCFSGFIGLVIIPFMLGIV